MVQPISPQPSSFGSLCEPNPKNRYHYLTLNMEITANAWKGQSTNPIVRTAQEVARVTLFPLLILAAFEAIVKNGTFLIINLCVALANKFVQVFYPNAKPSPEEEIFEPVPLSPTEAPNASPPTSGRRSPASPSRVGTPALGAAPPLGAGAAPGVEAGAPPAGIDAAGAGNNAEIPLGAAGAGAPPAAAGDGAGDPLGGDAEGAAAVIPEPGIQWRPLAVAGAAIAGTILLGPGGAATLLAPAIPNRQNEAPV